MFCIDRRQNETKRQGHKSGIKTRERAESERSGLPLGNTETS